MQALLYLLSNLQVNDKKPYKYHEPVQPPIHPAYSFFNETPNEKNSHVEKNIVKNPSIIMDTSDVLNFIEILDNEEFNIDMESNISLAASVTGDMELDKLMNKLDITHDKPKKIIIDEKKCTYVPENTKIKKKKNVTSETPNEPIHINLRDEKRIKLHEDSMTLFKMFNKAIEDIEDESTRAAYETAINFTEAYSKLFGQDKCCTCCKDDDKVDNDTDANNAADAAPDNAD